MVCAGAHTLKCSSEWHRWSCTAVITNGTVPGELTQKPAKVPCSGSEALLMYAPVPTANLLVQNAPAQVVLGTFTAAMQ